MNLDELTDEQVTAFDRIASRVVNRRFEDDRRLVLRAPGGTGKSHVLRKLSHYLNENGITHVVTAFTGRACSQIAKEGIANTKTMHSLFLKPVLDENGDLVRWEEKELHEVKDEVGNAILVDEASMMPYDMYHQMLSVPDISIILVGDSAQLPSIEPDETKGFDAMRLPVAETLTLTRNFRQEAGSGIMDLCEHLRESPTIPRRKKHDVKMIPKSKVMTLPYHKATQHDVVLCGLNKTRRKLNDLIRTARGFEGDLPRPGETILCKRNDVVNGIRINNGELFRVDTVFYGEETSKFMLSSVDRDQKIPVVVLNESWETEKAKRRYKGKPIQLFTFGYAITVHAAQGSQFDDILFVDEDVSFFLDQQRWRYTAVSRAARMLTIAL